MALMKNNINTVLLNQLLRQEKLNRVNNSTDKLCLKICNLHENCSCNSCQQLSEAEKNYILKFLKTAGENFLKMQENLDLGIGIGGGLISPLAASAIGV